MSAFESLAPRLDRARRAAFLLGVIALAACALGAYRDPTQFFRSYLVAYLYWIGIALGCVAIVMLHHLVGGQWGYVIRRLLESGSRTFVVLAALFVPLLFGLSRLYEWTQSAAVAADPILQQKQWYLNLNFFLVRAVLYFAAWLALAYFLNRWSFEQDRTANPLLVRRLEGLSGPGIVIYGLTVTFAAVDWVMSLEPHWFSTIYGMLIMVVQVLAAMAFVIVVLMLLADTEPLASALRPGQLNDLGNLLLTFVMLWAYLSFSQFLIIWSGNLQNEIPWYTVRATGAWGAIAVFLLIFHFAVPFFLLLMRTVKRRAHMLAGVAVALLVVSLVDVYWLVVPTFERAGPRVHWMDVLSVIGIGGIWIAAFLTQLKGQPLLPLHDPRFEVELEGAVGHGD
jgi:hypothetical protein